MLCNAGTQVTCSKRSGVEVFVGGLERYCVLRSWIRGWIYPQLKERVRRKGATLGRLLRRSRIPQKYRWRLFPRGTILHGRYGAVNQRKAVEGMSHTDFGYRQSEANRGKRDWLQVYVWKPALKRSWTYVQSFYQRLDNAFIGYIRDEQLYWNTWPEDCQRWKNVGRPWIVHSRAAWFQERNRHSHRNKFQKWPKILKGARYLFPSIHEPVPINTIFHRLLHW